MTHTLNNPSASAKADYHRRKREQQRLNVPLFVAALDGVKTPEQILLEREQAERLDRMIDQLKPPRAGLAVRYYYGIRCEPATLEQVAQKFGVTRERVRQILAKAVRTLRHWILRQENPKLLREIEDRESEQRKTKFAASSAKLLAIDAACEAERMVRKAVEREVERKQRLAQLAEEEKRQAQRDYDYCYVEAHRLNALWELELERRADEKIRQVRMAERRLQEEWTEAYRLDDKREVEVERNWLLVGSK